MEIKKEYSKIVLMSFIRIMKNKDEYELIQQTFKKVYKDSNNPLGCVTSFDGISDKLNELSIKMLRENKRFANDVYEFITILVNNLLHFIYEPVCNSKSSIGLIGQEIFDLACYRIFGDKYFEDMNKLNNGAKRPETEEEALLVGEYMSLINNGHKISWDDFLKTKKAFKKANKNMFDEAIIRLSNMDEVTKYFTVNPF
jgi:hypothetical protein